ncbi:hypothetical protein PVAP13_6NG102009 [Panicum virgatum]|uniref:Uncharacterized protein n=2 Tax=Panicum virgatum TaxID=38727 RepID=A0A8T0QW22_PANVG|nr:hypothetical protein PVAP13_6NG102009 [Panicum virgatum]
MGSDGPRRTRPPRAGQPADAPDALLHAVPSNRWAAARLHPREGKPDVWPPAVARLAAPFVSGGGGKAAERRPPAWALAARGSTASRLPSQRPPGGGGSPPLSSSTRPPTATFGKGLRDLRHELAPRAGLKTGTQSESSGCKGQSRRGMAAAEWVGGMWAGRNGGMG